MLSKQVFWESQALLTKVVKEGDRSNTMTRRGTSKAPMPKHGKTVKRNAGFHIPIPMLRLTGKVYPNVLGLRCKSWKHRGSIGLVSGTPRVAKSHLVQGGDRYIAGGSINSARSKYQFLISRSATEAAKEERILKNGNVTEKQSLSMEVPALVHSDVVETHRNQLLEIAKRSYNNPKIVALLSAGAAAAGVLVLVAVTSVTVKEDGDRGLTAVVSEFMASLSTGLNKFRKSTVEVGNGVANVIKRFADKINGAVSKAIQAGVATVVLLQCLNAVLLYKGEFAVNELGSWWRFRVAALLADLAGASDSRRSAVVEAGDGAVVDWLLGAVGNGDPACSAIQAEAARAIAHLLADTGTCEKVLRRPNALSHLLLFTASIQPQTIESIKSKNLPKIPDFGDRSRGRSLLVAAIMDIITSSCETGKGGGFRPELPKIADARDIAAALKVIEEGGLHLDDSKDSERGDGDDKGGLHGIGIRVLGGTGVVGLQRNQYGIVSEIISKLTKNVALFMDWSFATRCSTSYNLLSFSNTKASLNSVKDSMTVGKVGTANHSFSSYGLWDDLQGRYVAVPLAAWALAAWAQASSANQAKIVELDKHGDALMAAVMAPERTVKWHGAITIHSLFENKELSLDEMAATWSPPLLGMAVQASNVEDGQLALVALNAFSSCIKDSASAQKTVLEKSLPLMRALAKQTRKDNRLQKALAEALEVLSFSGPGLSLEEGKGWSGILLNWVRDYTLENVHRSSASRVLARVLSDLGQAGILVSQAWLAMLLMDAVNFKKTSFSKGDASLVKSKEVKAKGVVQSQLSQSAIQGVSQLAKVVLQMAAAEVQGSASGDIKDTVSASPLSDLLSIDIFQNAVRASKKDLMTKVTAADAASVTLKAIKCLTELAAEDKICQQRIIEAGGLSLFRRFLLSDDYEKWAATEAYEASKLLAAHDQDKVSQSKEKTSEYADSSNLRVPPTAHIRKHAARLLSILSLVPTASVMIKRDEIWCKWLEDCADGKIAGCKDLKTLSYARAALLNVSQPKDASMEQDSNTLNRSREFSPLACKDEIWPRYEDMVFLLNSESYYWKQSYNLEKLSTFRDDATKTACDVSFETLPGKGPHFTPGGQHNNEIKMDVVFVHGLCGGPFKTWRVADDKVSTTGRSSLVEKVDVETGKEGTCWPKEWLASDLPFTRLLTVKYKTNLSQWSGATLPLQEVSSILLDKLLAAGVGERPVVFVTHSMGGLVVKQMLLQAGQNKTSSHLVDQTSGIVFYSCPHFGSKLADVPWRIGLVLRPAPSIGELRSGSPKLEELNYFIRNLYKNGLEILSFSETKVTPLVEGYGGWALRMEVVPIESAYPGYGELVVLDGTDHVNSCKPLSRTDPAYTATLHFLQKLEDSLQLPCKQEQREESSN